MSSVKSLQAEWDDYKKCPDTDAHRAEIVKGWGKELARVCNEQAFLKTKVGDTKDVVKGGFKAAATFPLPLIKELTNNPHADSPMAGAEQMRALRKILGAIDLNPDIATRIKDAVAEGNLANLPEAVPVMNILRNFLAPAQVPAVNPSVDVRLAPR